MKTNKTVIFLIGSLMLVAGYNFISCKRPVKPKAIVTVVNEKDEPVEGAMVTVRADSGRVIYLSSGMVFADSSLTNSAGQVSYEFMYNAIYNVKAKIMKRVGNVNTKFSGSGVLILKEDETYSETIKIR